MKYNKINLNDTIVKSTTSNPKKTHIKTLFTTKVNAFEFTYRLFYIITPSHILKQFFSYMIHLIIFLLSFH